MNLVRRAMLFCAVGLLAASAANAGVPNATASTQPNGLRLVDLSGGLPDASPLGIGGAGGVINYTIRDASLNPVPGSVVVLNFTACTDVRICSAQGGVGMSVNCAAHTVTGVTNATGQITFLIAGDQRSAGVPKAGRCVSVTADGVPLNSLSAAAPDYSPSTPAALSALDVSGTFGDVATNRNRSDLDGNGTVNALDVSAEFGLVVYGPWDNSGYPGRLLVGTDTPCGAYCP